MNKDVKQKYRTFIHSPQFGFLPTGDRYLTDRGQPQYKFNVIGAGTIGQEHIYVTLLEGRATIKGVYDPNPSSLEAAQAAANRLNPDHKLHFYKTLDAACNDPDVDGLIICTPNYTHLEVVQEAIQSGKHILLEKPIATTVADAVTIANIAEEYPAVFQVGLQYRYKPTYREAIYEALERQSVGEIKTIAIAEHRLPFLDKVGQWNKFKQKTGDTLIEKCCHYFDLLNLFAGARPLNVYASGGMAVAFTEFEYNGTSSDIMDHAMVIVNYENGIKASFQLNMYLPMFYEELVICGDDGYLKTVENVDFLPQSSSGNSLQILNADNRVSRRSTPNYPAIIEESGHHGATYFEHAFFVDNIEGKETKTASAQEGLWAVVVAAAAQESIKTGQVVDINTYLGEQNIEI